MSRHLVLSGKGMHYAEGVADIFHTAGLFCVALCRKKQDFSEGRYFFFPVIFSSAFMQRPEPDQNM